MVDMDIHVTEEVTVSITEFCGTSIAGMFAVRDLDAVLSRIACNLVLNLSGTKVSDAVYSLLCKGYQFAPIVCERVQSVVSRTRKCIDNFLYAISDKLSYAEYQLSDH
jgi:hypothetical protein